MINLKENKTYYIRTLNSYNHFIVEANPEGYYLNFLESSNNCLFVLSKINPVSFTKQILGYYMSGIFPYCRTIEDLTKLLSELLKELENRGFIFTCDFEYKDPNFCSYWND